MFPENIFLLLINLSEMIRKLIFHGDKNHSGTYLDFAYFTVMENPFKALLAVDSPTSHSLPM